jgi:membrane-associated phospholipid phosphatase
MPHLLREVQERLTRDHSSNRLLSLDRAVVATTSSLPRPRLLELVLQVWAEGVRGPLWLLAAVAGPRSAGVSRWRSFAGAFAAYGSTLAAEMLLKRVVRRPRPRYGAKEDANSAEVGDRYSFPSGHAMGAFAGAVALGTVQPSRRPGYLIAASLIAASRVYLGIHYPSDVLGGALIGSLLGGNIAVASRRMENDGQAERLLLAAGLAGIFVYLIGRRR